MPIDINEIRKLDVKRKEIRKEIYTRIYEQFERKIRQQVEMGRDKYVFLRVPSYVIETTAVKRYVKSGSPDVYKCMFMCVRAKGFAYGFSVVATLSVKGDDVRVLSLRSQPLYADPPSDVTPYVQDVAQEYLDFELVKVKSTPTVGELDAAKENLR